METLPAHKYIVRVERQSVFDPDATLSVEDSMVCPRCKKQVPLLEHGGTQKCEHCKLHMERFGNGLTVW